MNYGRSVIVDRLLFSAQSKWERTSSTNKDILQEKCSPLTNGMPSPQYFLFSYFWKNAKLMRLSTQFAPQNILDIYKYYVSHSSVPILQNTFFDTELIHITFPVKLQPIKPQLLKLRSLNILLTQWYLNYSETLKVKPMD